MLAWQRLKVKLKDFEVPCRNLPGTPKFFQFFLFFCSHDWLLFDGTCPPDVNNIVKSNEKDRDLQFWTTKVRKRNVRFRQVFKFQIMR